MRMYSYSVKSSMELEEVISRLAKEPEVRVKNETGHTAGFLNSRLQLRFLR